MTQRPRLIVNLMSLGVGLIPAIKGQDNSSPTHETLVACWNFGRKLLSFTGLFNDALNAKTLCWIFKNTQML